MDKIMRNGVVDLLIQLSMQFNIDTETMFWVVFAVGMRRFGLRGGLVGLRCCILRAGFRYFGIVRFVSASDT